jgi:hypothetical protein
VDPQATWNELHDAVADRDWERVEELADALLEWIGKGGFPPKTSAHPRLTQSWHKDVTHCVCHLALASLKKARTRAKRRKGGPR